MNEDEKKAKEIAEKNGKLKMYFNGFELDGVDFDAFPECYDSAIEMAKWKDEQFQEERKQWIEFLESTLQGGVHPQGVKGFIEQFKQSMEE